MNLRAAAGLYTKLFRVPLARGDRICTQQMNVSEVVMVRRVEFDQRSIRTQHIRVKKPAGIRRAAADVADVGNRRPELGAGVELLLIRRLHILGAPSEVP